MATLYAQPYDGDKHGFQFTDLEEFEEKEDASNAEEFEIQFLDGDANESALFSAGEVAQAALEDYFALTELDEHEQVQALVVLDIYPGDLSAALEKYEDVSLTEAEDSEEYASQLVEDMGGVSQLDQQTIDNYFDYASFGHDMEMGGDIAEIVVGGTTYFYSPADV